MERFFSFAESLKLQTAGLLSNSFDSLEAEIISSSEFIEAKTAYLSDPQACFEALEERLRRILAVNESSGSRDPYDTAIATYLLLVLKADPTKVKRLLKLFAATRLNNLWWARYAIRRLDNLRITSATATATLAVPIPNAPPRDSASTRHIQFRTELNNSAQSNTTRIQL